MTIGEVRILIPEKNGGLKLKKRIPPAQVVKDHWDRFYDADELPRSIKALARKSGIPLAKCKMIQCKWCGRRHRDGSQTFELHERLAEKEKRE